MASEASGSPWISVGEGRRMLGIGDRAMSRLIESGQLTVRRVGKSWPRLVRAEVEALAEASTRPAVAS